MLPHRNLLLIDSNLFGGLTNKDLIILRMVFDHIGVLDTSYNQSLSKQLQGKAAFSYIHPKRIPRSPLYNLNRSLSIEQQVDDWLYLNPCKKLHIACLEGQKSSFEVCFEYPIGFQIKDIISNLNAPYHLPQTQSSSLNYLTKTKGKKVFYFDIDGCLIDYNEEPYILLQGGNIQDCLKSNGFEVYACLSGWSDMSKSIVGLSQDDRHSFLHQKLKALFPDQADFIEKLLLIDDTDNRCRYINFESDWLYVDDWAYEFFSKAHGSIVLQHYGARVIQVDPFSDGSELIKALNNHSSS